MTDEELTARLRLPWPKDGSRDKVTLPLWVLILTAEAADRIEALTAKLAKTAKVALAYEDWVTDAYDLLEERREEFDPESPSDKAIMDLMDKAEAGIARATLAEIKGESHE